MTEEKRYGVDQTYNLGMGASNPACAVNKTKPNFVLGMVVRLKSGGPDMTITEGRQEGGTGGWYYECTWFGMKEAPESHWFAAEALRAKEGDKPT